jgi:hypothetical protein
VSKLSKLKNETDSTISTILQVALANLEEATTLYLEESPLISGSPVTGAFVTTFHISEVA